VIEEETKDASWRDGSFQALERSKSLPGAQKRGEEAIDHGDGKSHSWSLNVTAPEKFLCGERRPR
jgi:hypothetical protein